MESTDTVTVIDYQILYRNGTERSFRHWPKEGDTCEETDKSVVLIADRGNLRVRIERADIVEFSKHVRQVPKIDPSIYTPKTKSAKDGPGKAS